MHMHIRMDYALVSALRSDVMDYHGEANLSFRCLEKDVKEVCPVSIRLIIGPQIVMC
jgi:hypothetical protein